MSNPMQPSISLLCKLASITVHADELLSPLGHEVDKAALTQSMIDGEVKEWLEGMTKMGMAPVKRTFNDLRANLARRKSCLKTK